jgi:SAM-dependent methyltransferase
MNKEISSKKDAYGQEVWAYLNGKKWYEVIERDDSFVDVSPGGEDYFQAFKGWPKHQRQAIKFVRGRVLDVGAGAGRVSLYLQKKGLKVTAIDNSPLAIRVCKKRGVKDARVLPIEKIAIFKPNTFDSIVMYGNNFGLFGSFKKAKMLLKKLYRITTPRAVIIAESNDPYKTKDPAHISYHKFNLRRGRMAGQLRIRLRIRNYIGDWFDYLIVSRPEMRNILKGTGWKVKKFVDSGRSMYVAVIEKEAAKGKF